MAFNPEEIRYFLERNQEGITYFAIFFLLFTTIFMIFRRTFIKDDKEKGLAGILSIIIAAIGTWYLSRSEFLAIIQSYATLGIIVLFFIPLVIILAAIHNVNSTSKMRRGVVVIYGIISYVLITSNEIELSESSWLIGFILLLFVIIFDSTINKILSKQSGNTPSHPQYTFRP